MQLVKMLLQMVCYLFSLLANVSKIIAKGKDSKAKDAKKPDSAGKKDNKKDNKKDKKVATAKEEKVEESLDFGSAFILNTLKTK